MDLTDFTDEEISTLHGVLYDEAYYGDDEIVYTSKGDIVRSVLEKVTSEANKRNLW